MHPPRTPVREVWLEEYREGVFNIRSQVEQRPPRQAARRGPARFPEMTTSLSDNFYEQIKPRLHRRIGRELRLAHRVLDLGCGSCDLVRYLAVVVWARGHRSGHLRRQFPLPPAHSRWKPLPLSESETRRILSSAKDGSADAVVSMWAMHEMAKPEAILHEAHRILRPGGEIFIVDFPRDSLAQRLWNEDYYRPGEIEALLRDVGFHQVQGRVIGQGQVMWARGYRPPSSTGEP